MKNRLLLFNDVRGDFPIGHHTLAEARVYEHDEIMVNAYGAVSVRTPNGLLGIKPNEMKWLDREEGAEVKTGATFSPCRKYRPLLWRIWGDGPVLVGLCCNPSDADETRNDPTVTRMIVRAKNLGFSGFKMLNLHDWVSTDPGALAGVRFPVSIENDEIILRECSAAGMVLCGWGNASPLIPRRALAVKKMLREAGVKLHYLKMGATGQPWHPLYIGYKVLPVEWLSTPDNGKPGEK